MSAMAWLRVADDRLVRADRVIGVDLWGPPTHNDRQPTEAVQGQPARIVVHLCGPDSSWVHVATCAAVRGGELIVGLLSALASASERPAGVAFVYGLHNAGELSRWMVGPTIPVTDPRVPDFQEVRDCMPRRWLALPVRRGGAQGSP